MGCGLTRLFRCYTFGHRGVGSTFDLGLAKDIDQLWLRGTLNPCKPKKTFPSQVTPSLMMVPSTFSSMPSAIGRNVPIDCRVFPSRCSPPIKKWCSRSQAKANPAAWEGYRIRWTESEGQTHSVTQSFHPSMLDSDPGKLVLTTRVGPSGKTEVRKIGGRTEVMSE